MALTCRVATIDHHYMAGHMGAAGRTQTDDRLGDLFWLTKSALRNGREHRGLGFWAHVQHLLDQRRADKTWSNRVHSDSLRGVLQCCAFRETRYAMFCRDASNRTGRADQPTHR